MENIAVDEDPDGCDAGPGSLMSSLEGPIGRLALIKTGVGSHKCDRETTADGSRTRSSFEVRPWQDDCGQIWLAAVKIVRFQSADRLGKTLNHYRKCEELTKCRDVFQMTALFSLLNNSMQDTKKPLPMFSFICSPPSTFLHRHSPTKTFKPKSVFMPPVFWCNFNLQLFSSRWTLDLSIMQEYWHRVLTFCIVSFPRLHPDTMKLPTSRLLSVCMRDTQVKPEAGQEWNQPSGCWCDGK